MDQVIAVQIHGPRKPGLAYLGVMPFCFTLNRVKPVRHLKETPLLRLYRNGEGRARSAGRVQNHAHRV